MQRGHLLIIRHYGSRGTGFDPAIAGMQFFSGRVVFYTILGYIFSKRELLLWG